MRMSPFLTSGKSAGFAWKRNAFSHASSSTLGTVIITWHNYSSWMYLIMLLFLSLFPVNRGWTSFAGVLGRGWQGAESVEESLLSARTSGVCWDQRVKAFVYGNVFSQFGKALWIYYQNTFLPELIVVCEERITSQSQLICVNLSRKWEIPGWIFRGGD